MNDIDIEKWKSEIFQIRNETAFDHHAWQIYHYQLHNNPLYNTFVSLNHRVSSSTQNVAHLSFLPIECFKQHDIITGTHTLGDSKTFLSSGTTGSVRSKHIILDISLYEQSFFRGFQRFFGKPEDYNIFALLPSYLERGEASLVYMVDNLIQTSASNEGGFFLDDFAKLEKKLKKSLKSHRKTMLIGVTFALLDFSSFLSQPLPSLIVVETGGMKGRRKELVKEEVYMLLKQNFGVPEIFSEYGMTELCSQAWSKTNGKYVPPPWMKVSVRDLNDPWCIMEPGKSGGINIIDLANLHSCAFLATQDIGSMNQDGSFNILGRIDGSESRGCNLMFF